MFALNNGVGALPFMGWTTWDSLGSSLAMNETTLRATADALVSLNLSKLGYTRLNVDDAWGARLANGSISSVPSRFPSGMAALASYVHARGLLFGLYTDVGSTTCAGYAGSYGHEAADAAAFASWGVDFLKEDHCNVPNPLPPGIADENTFYNYALAVMRDALNATGRRIHFDLCAHTCYGALSDAACWAQWYANASALGNSRRTTTDASHTWPSVLMNWYRNDAFGNGSLPLAPFSAPFAYNDPDALQVGNLPASVSQAQAQTHFSAWCVMAAPLILGVRLDDGAPPRDVLAIVSNADAIAIDQDALGVQGTRVRVAGAPIYFLDEYRNGLVRYPQEVWAKPLENGDRAVFLVNHDPANSAAVEASIDDIALKYPPAMAGNISVFDVWEHDVVGNATGGSYAAILPPNSSRLLRFSAIN